MMALSSISSMEDSAIQQGFDSLKDGAEYDSLFAASECRAKADWLIGMNGTRAFTKKYGRRQNIGRVQTPTLAMLTERQNKIQNFVKEPYGIPQETGTGRGDSCGKCGEKAGLYIGCEPIRLDSYTQKKMTFFFDPDGLPLELHE